MLNNDLTARKGFSYLRYFISKLHKPHRVLLFVLIVSLILVSPVFSQTSGKTVLSWLKVRGAIGYLIEIVDNTGSTITRTKTDKTELTINLPAGNYKIKISPINKFSKPEESTWQNFSVSIRQRPDIDSLTPNMFLYNQNVSELSIIGNNFDPNARVVIETNRRSYTIGNPNVISSNKITFHFSPSQFGEGSFSVNVINPGSIPAFEKKTFRIVGDASNNTMQTPVNSSINIRLIHAIKAGNTNSVKFLIQQGANPAHMDNSGFSTVHYAAAGGFLDILKYLNEKGGDMFAKDPRGATPLHHACYTGKLNIVSYLIETVNSDLNTITSLGYAPLDRAAIKSNYRIVEYLLNKGANSLYQVNSGETPLHFATYSGNLQTVKMLLESNPSLLEMMENRGYTALHYSAWYGHESITNYLISKNANKQTLSKNGETPLDMAKKSQKYNIIRILE